MAASKALYNSMADSFRIVLNRDGDPVTVSRIAQMIAIDLKADNSAFSAAKFFRACGLSEDGYDVHGD